MVACLLINKTATKSLEKKSLRKQQSSTEQVYDDTAFSNSGDSALFGEAVQSSTNISEREEGAQKILLLCASYVLENCKGNWKNDTEKQQMIDFFQMDYWTYATLKL